MLSKHIPSTFLKWILYCFFHYSASLSWVNRFKARHNIVSRAISGESGVVDTDVTAEWKEKTLPALLKDYEPRNIFNADETGMLNMAYFLK